MALGLGYKGKLAVGKETTFGSAIDIATQTNSMSVVPFIDENFKEDWALMQKQTITGKTGWRTAERDVKIVTGTLNSHLSYDFKVATPTVKYIGTDLLLAAALGTPLWVVATTSHQITLEEELSKFITIAMVKLYDETTPANSLVTELVSCMAKTMEISGAAGEPIKLGIEYQCYDLLRTGTSNTAAELNALTSLPPRRVFFSDLKFNIASDFSDALADGTDALPISSFVLKLDNNLSDPTHTTPDTTGIPAGGLICQSSRAGIRDVTLEVTFPRYENDTFVSSLSAITPFQAEMTFTLTAGTYIKLYFPNLVVKDAGPNISGPDPIENTIIFQALRGADYNSQAGNTVMKFADAATLITEEFAIETDNQRDATIW